MLKKILFTIFTLAIFCLNTNAQSPEGFNYQCIVRDNTGHSLTSQAISVRFNILQGSITGSSVYSETHATSTNGYGLVTLMIGTGTTVDDLSLVNWASGPYYIHVEVDPNAGTSYDNVSTTQMMSVPYALHSKTADNVTNDQVNDADADPTNEIQDISLVGSNLSISGGSTLDLSLISNESDPIFGAAAASSITTSDIGNWNTTFGWGNHAAQGYLLSEIDGSVTNEIQDISIVGSDLTITNGSTITLPADNDWTISGNNMFNSNSGFVGIGTSFPNTQLQVTGLTGEDILRLQINGGSTRMFMKDNGFVGIGGFFTPSNSLDISGGMSVGNYYSSTAPNNGLIVSGNVGVGTTSPITPLDVEGTVRTGWKGYSDRMHVMPSDLRASTGTGNWSMNTGSSGSSRGNTIRVYGGTDAYASIMIPQGYYVSGYKVDFDANPCDMIDVYENSTASNIPILRSSINPNGFTSFIEAFNTGDIIEGGNGTYVTIHFENVSSNEFTLEGMILYIIKCPTGDCGL